MFLASVFGVLIPLFFLYLVHLLEIYATSRHDILWLSVIWGVFSFFIAYLVNRFILDKELTTLAGLHLIGAPIVEETLKSVFLIILARRLILRYAADGMAYGFAIGTGFAIVENMAYVINKPATGLQLAMTRSLSTSLVHGFDTAIIGTIAGASLFLSTRTRLNRFLLGLALVVSTHAIFNFVVGNLSGALLLLTAIGIGLGSIAIIILIMRQTLQNESKAIHLELAGVLSAGELAAARNPEMVAQLLAQHRGEIGENRTRPIQHYVTLQAQRGILRKNIALSQNAKLVEILNRQLQTTEQQLDILRGNMGLYTWIWLRSVLPSEESDLWLQLDNQLTTEQPQLARLIQLNERQVLVPPSELEERKHILRQGALFNAIADEDLVDLALLLVVRQYQVGAEVIRQGERSDCLFITAAGTLVVSVMNDQQQQTMITAFSVGDAFGDMEILDGDPSTVTVTCLEDVTLYTLLRADLITLLYAKPQVALEMMRVLSQRLRHQTALMVWVQQTASNGT
ncbi:MAG: PrsW family intramembrane metalloprotease [Chloroflexi bacterium]|nr:PrsW family intramembrane metalloprotease [Chloroflexota bacterium]